MPFTHPMRRISQSLALCAGVAILCNVVFARQCRADDPVPTLSQVTELYDKMEAADRRLPRDTFDPRAIIETVGRDPNKLFDWVQSNTILLPYRGALRGPVGVLMDRGGSSLDRALLLATLLHSTGWEVR